MTESWKKVPGFPGYMVSSSGLIKSLSRRARIRSGSYRIIKERILARTERPDGYLNACLWLNNKPTMMTVHHIVAKTFLGSRSRRKDICHNNGIRSDNRVENLRYDNRKNNSKDRIAHGTIYNSNTKAKLSLTEVRMVKSEKGRIKAKELAARLNLKDVETIRKIWRGETWVHV